MLSNNDDASLRDSVKYSVLCTDCIKFIMHSTIQKQAFLGSSIRFFSECAKEDYYVSISDNTSLSNIENIDEYENNTIFIIYFIGLGSWYRRTVAVFFFPFYVATFLNARPIISRFRNNIAILEDITILREETNLLYSQDTYLFKEFINLKAQWFVRVEEERKRRRRWRWSTGGGSGSSGGSGGGGGGVGGGGNGEEEVGDAASASIHVFSVVARYDPDVRS
ncbi:uncharacterized protein V1478_006291 [Vespula squamosa]|uniref:Uncharacterized protein n=1 Tax=Vespula squamosa TaxID=30214 RepID=A0ABD2B7F4_VESSQ